MAKKILLFADDAMVSLGGFFDKCNVLIELLLGGEGNTIDSLQTVIGCFSEPVGRRVLEDFEGFNTAGVGYMGASTQINQVAIAVGGNLTAVGDLVGDELNLEGILSEQSQSLFLTEDDPLEHLLLSDDFLCCLLNGFIVILREMPSVSAESVIEETTVSRGTVAKVHTVLALHGLSKDMRA